MRGVAHMTCGLTYTGHTAKACMVITSRLALLSVGLVACVVAAACGPTNVILPFPDAALDAPDMPDTSVRVTAPNGGETWPAGSSQAITWGATGVTDVSVELTTDGTTWTTLSRSTPAAAGQLMVTVPAPATTAAQIRLTAVPGGAPSDVSDAPFTIRGGVFLNEVLANEPLSDTNGEFVELVNSGADADLSGWTISDATAVRHVFAAGTVLRTGRAVVVFAGAASIPAGLGNAIAASTGALSLANGGDTVTLASPTATVDSVTYSSTLAGTDGVSMNRSPDGDLTGTFVLHTTLSASNSSPGVRVDGTAF